MPAYPLAFPDTLIRTSESFIPENASRSGGASITGSEQVVSSGASRIRAKIGVSAEREQGIILRAFLWGMRGMAGTCLVGPKDVLGAPLDTSHGGDVETPIYGTSDTMTKGYPVATNVAGALAAAASLRASQIVIGSMPPYRLPFAGNWIGLGGGRLHVLTDVADNGDGTWTCGVEPLLRADYAAGTPVSFGNPLCLMRFATQPPDPTKPARGAPTDLTLDLVEVF